MARILAVGSPHWTSHRTTMTALRRVMDVYRDPYTLVCDMSDGAARYAAAGARQLGWAVEAHELDTAKCADDCPTEGHRRAGGPTGEFCPTARARNTLTMAQSGIHVVLVFVRPLGREDGSRAFPKSLRLEEFAVWQYTQKETIRGNTQK